MGDNEGRKGGLWAGWSLTLRYKTSGKSWLSLSVSLSVSLSLAPSLALSVTVPASRGSQGHVQVPQPLLPLPALEPSSS